MTRKYCLVICVFFPILSANLASADDIEDSRYYGIRSVSFAELGQDMCVDIVNGGALDNQITLASCANHSGQFWHLTRVHTELRHLPTYRLTTMFRGDAMCLTLDGTLRTHTLRLAPCADTPAETRIWIVMPWQGPGRRPGDSGAPLGWRIMPLLDETGNDGGGLSLQVAAPPEGDGQPHVDAIDEQGSGFVWSLDAR